MTGRSISIRSTILFPERGVRVSVGFWVILAVAALISPLEVVVSVLLAAAVHECGHLLFLRLLHVPVGGLRLSALGAEIFAPGTQRISYGGELLVTLAGPAVNLLTAVIFAEISLRTQWLGGYLFAGTNIILGAYNLLPILPLDGGRTVYLVTAFFFGPMIGDAVAAVVGTACALSLLVLGIYLSVVSGSGMFFLLASVSLLFRTLPQLALAKNAVKV